MQLAPDQLRLIDGWQRAFPLVPRPFAAIAEALGTSEARVLEMLRALDRAGVLSRIGVTVRPNTAGASLLAAMRVEPARLDEIAAVVSDEPCVNHNYEREHEFNLWFVVTAADKPGLETALARLRAATGHDIMELPLERGYHIDLGFALSAEAGLPRAAGTGEPAFGSITVGSGDRAMLAALEDGLEIQPRPYLAVGRGCGRSETEVIDGIERLIGAGVVTRFGLIVRHRPLGIAANAMVVWDIDDRDVDRVGQLFAGVPYVTLCYRRPRRLPHWRYNLFSMVHGRDRAVVEQQIDELTRLADVSVDRRAILFSRRCFVQRGARFKAA